MIRIKKRPIFIAIIISVITIIMFLINSPRHTIPAITYFPIDEHTRFLFTTTDLKPIKTSDENTDQFIWKSQSKSDKPLYLRQDISLLYENGYFKGLLSKWSEQTDTVELQKTINHKKNNLYQAISYHYGEVHHNENIINSIQQMSSTDFLSSNHSIGESPETQSQIISSQISTFWNQVIEDYDIDKSLYLAVPLTNLDYYNSKTLPLLTSEETDKVIGQLWEGLYKNYIIPITATKPNQAPHHVPMVLFDKESRHLIILFELDRHVQKLFQRYSF